MLCNKLKEEQQVLSKGMQTQQFFMGYSNTQKGYRLYDIQNKHSLLTRDILFHDIARNLKLTGTLQHLGICLESLYMTNHE